MVQIAPPHEASPIGLRNSPPPRRIRKLFLCQPSFSRWQRPCTVTDWEELLKTMAYSATFQSGTGDPVGTYRIGNNLYNSATGALMQPNQGPMNDLLKSIVSGQQKQAMAAVDTAEAADTMALNQQASANTTQLARNQGMGGRRTAGGGAFRSRNPTANSAIAGLSSANAKALGAKKRQQVTAQYEGPAGQMSALAQYQRQITGGQ